MSEPGHPNYPAFGVPEFPAYTVPPHQYVTGMAPKAKLIPCKVTNSVLVGYGIFIAGDSIPALTKALYYAAKLSEADATVGVVSIESRLSPRSWARACKRAPPPEEERSRHLCGRRPNHDLHQFQ